MQTPEETLDKASGSCRDSGWLLVQILRHLGIAARFASGYLIQLVADVKPLEGPAGADRDFTDLHAWAEAYIPGAGWIGLDPTSGLAGRRRTYSAGVHRRAPAAPRRFPVSPTSRTCKFGFEMSVTRIHEDPARHAPVYRRAVVRDRCAGRARRCGAHRRRRAAHARRRAHVRLDRQDGRPRMEFHGDVACKAPPCRNIAAAPQGAFRTGRHAARRTGEMVSGRTAPALGARRLLARRWRAALARRRVDCRLARAGSRHGRVGPHVHRAAHGTSRHSGRPCTDRVRGCVEDRRSTSMRCRRTSIRSTSICRCPASARESPACCARASTSRPGSCCR